MQTGITPEKMRLFIRQHQKVTIKSLSRAFACCETTVRYHLTHLLINGQVKKKRINGGNNGCYYSLAED